MTAINPVKLSALIGFSDEWMSRSMETVFQERGYETTRVASGRQALKFARRGVFDVIMLDERMDVLTGVEVCIALRDDPLFDHATPIVIVSSSHTTLPSRTAAYAAGAWEYCHQPLDVDSLFLKLGTFLRARRELAAAQAQSLMDPASGFYTQFGLNQLTEQLEARAVRNHEPIACLAFSSQSAGSSTSNPTVEDDHMRFAEVLHVVREQARKSDVVAKTGASQLSILAPDTDAAGARLLVARLQRELDAVSKKTPTVGPFQLRAGYCAVADLATANVDLNELVHRAESALAHVPPSGKGSSVVSFDELPLS
ncbi:MAG: response regulator [Gemmatimonadaceae bacterium]